jgi:ribosome-binding protein aMBF1 (putative translation factor)
MTTAHDTASAPPIHAEADLEDQEADRPRAIAATHTDPAVREAACFLLDEPPAGEVVEVEEEGPGFYRAPAVASALAGAVVAYRKRAGLTQRRLAQRLLLHQSAIARLEAGKHTPDLETLVRLARRLGLDLTVRVTPRGATLEVRDAAASR